MMGLGTFFLIVLICVIIFIAIRELLCWYYKINKMVSNQDEIIRLLKKIANEADTDTKLNKDKNGIAKDLVDGVKFMVTGKR